MDWIQYLPGLIVVIGVIIMVPLSKKAAINLQNRLSEWAKAEGVTIISQRGARFYEGPGAWLRTENQNMYRLEVRYVWLFQGPDAWRRSRNQTQYRVKVWDAQAQILHGWVTLGTYWGFMDWYKVSDVIWD